MGRYYSFISEGGILMENSSYTPNLEVKSWVYNSEVIVVWDGVLLVYPDFEGTNTMEYKRRT